MNRLQPEAISDHGELGRGTSRVGVGVNSALRCGGVGATTLTQPSQGVKGSPLALHRQNRASIRVNSR